MTTTLAPAQVFSAAAVGMGFNTPDQLAIQFKALNYTYFPLSNTGVMTDILAHEDAAYAHGLIPIYGRTITFKDLSLTPITFYAKTQTGRDWLYQQAVEYDDTKALMTALMTALMNAPLASVVVFFPNEWLNAESTANVVLCSKALMDTYCIVDARQSINTLSMGVSQYPAVIAMPINCIHAKDIPVFEAYHSICKSAPPRDHASLGCIQAKAGYAECRTGSLMHYAQLAQFLSKTHVEIDDIFEGFESIKPLREVTGCFKIDPSLTLKKVTQSLKRALDFKHSSGELHRLSESEAPVSLGDYDERLSYELSLFAKSDRNIELLNLFAIRQNIVTTCKLRGLRGGSSGLLICYLLGLTIVDPVANNIASETFFAKKNFRFDFELPSDVRENIFELISNMGDIQPVQLHYSHNWQPRSILRALIKDPAYASQRHTLERLNLSFKRYPTIVAAEELYDEVKQVLGEDSKVYKIIQRVTGLPISYGEHLSSMAFVPKGSAFGITSVSGKRNKDMLCLGLSTEDVTALDLPRCYILGHNVLDNMCTMFNSDSNKINGVAHIVPADKRVLAQISDVQVRELLPMIPRSALSFARDIPGSLSDVANQLALTREATILNGTLRQYLDRYPDAYPNAIESILAPTRGVLIYQQQALRIIRDGVKVPGLKAAKAIQCLFDGDNDAYLESLKGYKGKQQRELIHYVLENASSLFCEAHAMYYAKLIYMSSYFLLYARTEHICNELNHSRSQYFTPTEMLDYLLILINMGVKISGVDKNTNFKRITFTVKNDVIVPEGYNPILTPEDIRRLKRLI